MRKRVCLVLAVLCLLWARPVSAGAEAAARPPAVPVHNKGDMDGQFDPFHRQPRHTDMISFSFSAVILSISAMYLSVIF